MGYIGFYWILFITGYTIGALSNFFKVNHRERQFSPAITALGQIIMGISLWAGLNLFVFDWSPAGGIGIIIFSAMTAAAISNLGYYGENSGSDFIAEISHWIKLSSTVILFIAGLIAAFFVFIRPAMYSHFTYAFIIEWLIICAIAWRIFATVKNHLKKRYVVPAIEDNWRKHIQKVENIADEEFCKLVMLQEEYIETGTRRDLLNYLERLLFYNGFDSDEINLKLRSIIEHNDKKVPWYLIGFWRRRLITKNQQERRKALNDTIENLKLITQYYLK
jgi:hypothetical protein